MAQQHEFTVEKFQLVDDDREAFLSKIYSRSDNKLSALVKIYTHLKDLHIEGPRGYDTDTIMQKEGMVWVFLPSGSERIFISHDTGKVEYFCPSLVSGKTYEMYLNVGTGRFITINTNYADADIYVDNKKIEGKSGTSYYFTYGRHNIRAIIDDYAEGETQITIDENDDKLKSVQVQMKVIPKYPVTITTQAGAEILFEGKHVASSSWTTELREGEYTVETYMPDCDTTATRFSVGPGIEGRIPATAPVRHTGYLSLIYDNRVTMTQTGNQSVDLNASRVPVGQYSFHFERKGYDQKDTTLVVLKNQETRAEIVLHRKEFFSTKPSVYIGVSYDVSNLSGVSGIVGGVIKNHDISLSYTMGLGESKPVYWYSDAGFQSSVAYKQSVLSLKYGYRFKLLHQMALTPQVGLAYLSLGDNLMSGSKSYGGKANAKALTIGAKILVAPAAHCQLFVTPEYDIAVSKHEVYTEVSKSAGFDANRFVLSIGALINF